MCDSPTGLLVLAMKGLSLLAPRMQFTPEQLITFTNLAWLPGPEYAMRFWAHCATSTEELGKENNNVTIKPKVGITVFLGGDDQQPADETAAQEAGQGAIRLEALGDPKDRAGYSCPAWGKTHYDVLFSQRVEGQPGLLAWERPDVILAGIRGLAGEILKVDNRLAPILPDTTAADEALDSVVVDEETPTQEGGLKPPQRPTLEQGDSSRTRVGSPDGGLKPPERPLLEQGDSSGTKVGSIGSQQASSSKGKEIEVLPPPAPLDPAKRPEESGSDTPSPGTPDTVVLVTAPTDEVPTKP